MHRSESIINNLLVEVDYLSNRITNIMHAYCNTSHMGLRKRFYSENKIISQRLNEIYSIAKILKLRTNTKISYSGLLLEKCERAIDKTIKEKKLFFL